MWSTAYRLSETFSRCLLTTVQQKPQETQKEPRFSVISAAACVCRATGSSHQGDPAVPGASGAVQTQGTLGGKSGKESCAGSLLDPSALDCLNCTVLQRRH